MFHCLPGCCPAKDDGCPASKGHPSAGREANFRLACGPIQDARRRHDPRQPRNGVEGGEGDVGGGNLEDLYLPLPQIENPNSTQVRDPSRSEGSPLTQRHQREVGTTGRRRASGKAPGADFPNVEVLEHYNVVPEFVPINITEDTVKQISGRLTSAAGTGGIHAANLQQWLLRFGEPAPAPCSHVARLLDGEQHPTLGSNPRHLGQLADGAG